MDQGIRERVPSAVPVVLFLPKLPALPLFQATRHREPTTRERPAEWWAHRTANTHQQSRKDQSIDLELFPDFILNARNDFEYVSFERTNTVVDIPNTLRKIFPNLKRMSYIIGLSPSARNSPPNSSAHIGLTMHGLLITVTRNVSLTPSLSSFPRIFREPSSGERGRRPKI